MCLLSYSALRLVRKKPLDRLNNLHAQEPGLSVVVLFCFSTAHQGVTRLGAFYLWITSQAKILVYLELRIKSADYRLSGALVFTLQPPTEACEPSAALACVGLLPRLSWLISWCRLECRSDLVAVELCPVIVLTCWKDQPSWTCTIVFLCLLLDLVLKKKVCFEPLTVLTMNPSLHGPLVWLLVFNCFLRWMWEVF